MDDGGDSDGDKDIPTLMRQRQRRQALTAKTIVDSNQLRWAGLPKDIRTAWCSHSSYF